MSDLREALRRAICPCPECRGHEAVLARVEVVAKRFGATDDELPSGASPAVLMPPVERPSFEIDWDTVVIR